MICLFPHGGSVHVLQSVFSIANKRYNNKYIKPGDHLYEILNDYFSLTRICVLRQTMSIQKGKDSSAVESQENFQDWLERADISLWTIDSW